MMEASITEKTRSEALETLLEMYVTLLLILYVGNHYVAINLVSPIRRQSSDQRQNERCRCFLCFFANCAIGQSEQLFVSGSHVL